MHSTLKYVSIIAAAASLLACSGTSGRSEPRQAATPVFASADEAYMVGRGQHLAARFDAAVLSYKAALKVAPAHVNARNGLATLYAERGDFAQAIPLWQALTASMGEQTGPETAFLFSNLGYAYFLSGDYDNALAALEKACVLDPLNSRAWQHLGSALDKVGQPERAQQMYKQAETLKRHDFKADYAMAPRAGVAAIDSAVAAAEEDSEFDQTQVQQTDSGMFVMRRIAARTKNVKVVSAAAAVAVAAPVADSAAGSTLLEIRNGNGVTGMARSLAGTMQGSELQVVRLSNQKGFGVKQTRVEYQPEFRDAAERLAARFGAAKAVEVQSVERADVRLIIGSDLVKTKPATPAVNAGAAVPVKRG